MSTDSEESESENKLSMQQFRWTPAKETLLEEILMKHFFDFHAAAKEFTRIINDQASGECYQIDAKSLQLRWTDIEIRKYRLPQSGSPSKSQDAEEEKETREEEEDDLPPLEQKPSEEESRQAVPSSDEEEADEKVAHYTNLEELD